MNPGSCPQKCPVWLEKCMSDISMRGLYQGHGSDTGNGPQAEPSPARFWCLVCAGAHLISGGKSTQLSLWQFTEGQFGLCPQNITSVDQLRFLLFYWYHIGMLPSSFILCGRARWEFVPNIAAGKLICSLENGRKINPHLLSPASVIRVAWLPPALGDDIHVNPFIHFHRGLCSRSKYMCLHYCLLLDKDRAILFCCSGGLSKAISSGVESPTPRCTTM